MSKENTVALCAAVRQLGAAISVPISMMEQLPAAATPLRIAQIWTDRSPDLSELEMSDIIEFNFCSEKSAQCETYKHASGSESILSWPIDVQDTQGLLHRVAMLREITEYKIPIGFAVPAGNVHDDITMALECEVDFVVLTWSPSLFDEKGNAFQTIEIAEALLEVKVAKTATPSKRTNEDLKIIVDAPLESIDDFAKLFSLGANAWCGLSAIETLIRQPQPPQPNVGYSGMLSNYASQNRAPSIQPQVVERLQKYLKSLEYITARAGKTKPSELTEELLCEQKS
jgi:hypothetical protein